jgi:hypothetical protein
MFLLFGRLPGASAEGKREFRKAGDMKSILTVTMNPTIDKGLEADKVAPERKIRCRSVRHDPGGGGINVSRAIRKLEGPPPPSYRPAVRRESCYWNCSKGKM